MRTEAQAAHSLKMHVTLFPWQLLSTLFTAWSLYSIVHAELQDCTDRRVFEATSGNLDKLTDNLTSYIRYCLDVCAQEDHTFNVIMG